MILLSMKMKYEFDKEHIQALFRNFGLALTLGGLLYGALEDGDLRVTSVLCLTGIVFALLGSVKEKKL